MTSLYKIRVLVASACLMLGALSARGQSALVSVTGVVEDPTGAVISGARVEFSSGNYHVAAQTNSSGQFRLEIAVTSGNFFITGAGFLPLQFPWNRERQLKFVLHPQYESDCARFRGSRCSADPAAAPRIPARRESPCAGSAPAVPAALWFWWATFRSTIPSAAGFIGTASCAEAPMPASMARLPWAE